MANSIWTTEEFTCPGCGMDYAATREQHSHKHSGKFECRVCETEVHAWSGPYDFFGWKTINVRSPVFGRKTG
jgi:predicted RNA-binding Zn-ribbon protein involved in translation (DUF1610 family)